MSVRTEPPSTAPASAAETTERRDFIREIVAADLREGRHDTVVTRFPPEPNGYLHIGHAKSICLNFGVAQEFGGLCNLRFDDTNPVKEDTEYVESIKRDVRWLGFDWADREYYASDYFEQIHDCAVELIRKGLAYVDSSTADEIRAMRGTLTEPGKNSPYRDRSVEENLRLGAYGRRGRVSLGDELARVYRYFPVLRERRHQVGGTLSGGEQQMLAVGRALMLRPRLLLLDEPSLGLAPLVVREIFRIVRAINAEEGVGVLLVEQNASLALDLADHAYLLETGRVVQAGPAAELRRNDAVRRVYLGY